MRRIKVCKEIINGEIITTTEDLGLTSSPTSCTMSVPAYDPTSESGTMSIPCEYDCNNLDGYSETFSNQKRSIRSQEKDGNPIDWNNILLQIREKYYNNTKLEFEVKNSNADAFKVTIVNINGKIEKEQVFEISSKFESLYQIDLSNFKTGTYVYRVEVNGLFIKSNKFIIIR